LRGTSQLRGELKDKARTAVLSHFIMPVGREKNRKKQIVKWLLEDNIFIFGSLDFEV
jgi:hypothetical protein